MKPYKTIIELQKESMKFSAGHTTIFSATEREPLHGHQYQVYLSITAWVNEEGLTFDYRFYKQRIHALCRHLNQTFLMPQYSPYLIYDEDNDYYHFTFNGKTMLFLKEDVTLLPVHNITVEELSRWFVEQLTQDKEQLKAHQVEAICIKIFSAPGQSASFVYEN